MIADFLEFRTDRDPDAYQCPCECLCSRGCFTISPCKNCRDGDHLPVTASILAFIRKESPNE